MDTGIINIRGKEYQTVALRVAKFRASHPNWTIRSEIVHIDADQVLMRAEILDESGRLLADGFAEEWRASSQINKTSAVENCQTSAIGRALACAGFGGSEFASAASTSASNASSSASAASTSASNASTSATNAANSATAASGSASTASTQATNAASSATSAAGSATSAASARSNKLGPFVRIKGSGLLSKQRNRVVKHFLDSTDSDWLLMIDSDEQLDVLTFDKLCETAHDKERPVVEL